MTLPRACLGCGTKIATGSRCDSCTPTKAKTAARGYGARWQQLARQAIRQHPWCTDCGTSGSKTNPLTGDHLRWPAVSRADIEVVCRRCNSRRGPRRKVLTGQPDDPTPASQRVTQPGPVVA
jgi:5-methylcytosine-specific restriction endonuclease McrA